jgi:ABC-2 type transport system ATP-binding protein
MSMIELRSVVRRFGHLTAVDEVSLDVHEGEIVGLLGHNGAGKTTLIRLINGLLEPDSGTVRVGGMDPVADGHIVRRRTGVLTEYPALDVYLSVEENLLTYAAIHRVRRDVAQDRVDDLLSVLGLLQRRNTPARSLSAGLKQRVALARALVHDPEVLLLDEPTTNLDPVAASDVRELIRHSATERGHTIVLSTHNLSEAETLCDRIAILREGRVVSQGTVPALRQTAAEESSVRITTSVEWASVLLGTGNGWPVTLVSPEVVEFGGTVDVPDLIRRLVMQGVPVHRVEPREPTLESLYRRVHGRAPNEAASVREEDGQRPDSTGARGTA